MSELIGVYGGTFDPCTVGHWQSMKKACAIFDKIYVVIATADGKKTQFSQPMRLKMLESTIPFDLWSEDGKEPKIEIDILPEGVFLATYAKKKGAQFLIRGLRDAFDFHYENIIYQTNKRIEPDIETIYLMPSEELSLVSSSWVKSLVGHNGWRETIQPYVSEFTIKALAIDYARQRFEKMAQHPTLKLYENDEWNTADVWAKSFLFPLEKNCYHNAFHVLDCLEAMDLYYPQMGHPVMEFAFWMHDIVPSVDESIIIASNALEHASEETVKKVVDLIKTTKHTDSMTGEYETTDEQVFASIDLLCLGRPSLYYDAIRERMYEEYRNNVYNEYAGQSKLTEREFRKEWGKHRSDFAKSMLARNRIYPWKTLRDMFEGTAKMNLSREIQSLEIAKNNA